MRPELGTTSTKREISPSGWLPVGGEGSWLVEAGEMCVGVAFAISVDI